MALDNPGIAPVGPAAESGPRRGLNFGDFTLTEEQHNRLVGFLSEEIRRAEEETRPFREALATWRLFVDPKDEPKDFPWPGAPLARDTEVCTRTGWKRVDALHIGELVLTRRDDDALLEWAPVEATPRVFAETLYHFRSKSIDQQVTGEHQMVCRTESGHMQRMSARMAWQATGLRVPLTGKWLGAPVEDTLFGRDAGDVMELIGWYLAEGWTNTGPDGPNGTIFLAQSEEANPAKCRQIEMLLDRLEVGWKRLAASPAAYQLTSKTIPPELRHSLHTAGDAYTKRVPAFVFDKCPSLIQRLLAGWIAGDGWVLPPAAHQNLDHTAGSTVSAGLAGDIQTLVQLTGRRATIRTREPRSGGTIEGRQIHGTVPCYEVAILHKDYAKLDAAKAAEAVSYNDYAFCVTVRNHAIYVRRNGIASWTGNSNVFVPIPRTVLDALKASIKQTINRQLQHFVAEIDAAYAGIEENEVERAQRAAVKFAELIAQPGYLNLSRVIDEESEELLVAGIGPLRLTSEKDARPVMVRGGIEREVVFRTGPRLTTIPLDQWVWPAGYWRNVQEMPWVGQEVLHTPASLRLRAQPPWNYRYVEETLASRASVPATASEQQREDALRQIPRGSVIRTHEIELVWDVYGDGKFHDILVTLNIDAGRLHRVIYNPAGDGLKSYDVEVGSPRSGTIFGRGIIEPIVQPCRGINTAVNQTFDAQTLANAPSILYPEGSEAARILADGFAPGLPLPYKEAKDEISILKFPDPSATSFQMVQFFLQIVERLTRIGPNRLGEISAGRRTPASLGLASQQLGAELIDELIDRLRDTFGRLWARAFVLYLDDDPTIFVRVLGDEDGLLLRQIVERSKGGKRGVQEGLRIRLYASSATRSQELERQNAIAVAQLTFGAFRQMIELAQLFFQPNAPPAAQQILLDVLKSSQEQLRRIVELSNQPDAAMLIPDVAARLESLLSAPAAVPAPPGGLAPPPASPPIPPEMLAMMQQMSGGMEPA